MPELQVFELSPEEWTILEFHEGKDSVNSLQIENELSLEHRLVLESLHLLHYDGLIYFVSQRLGADESVISKINSKGLEFLRSHNSNLFKS